MTDPQAKSSSSPRHTSASGRIHPEVDWQAAVLATKVLRRVMTLAQACDELAGWQADALRGAEDWRPVEPRALIVTHMMNRLLDRGY